MATKLFRLPGRSTPVEPSPVSTSPLDQYNADRAAAFFQRASFNEDVAQLLTAIRPMARKDGRLSLHLAAAVAGDGTTTVAHTVVLHLLAVSRDPVLLIDANPSIDTKPAAVGLIDLMRTGTHLMGAIDVVKPGRFARAKLACDRVWRNAIPSTNELETLYATLGASWPLIVIDGAPILAPVNLANLAAASDCVVLVLRASHTRPEQVIRARDLIVLEGGRLAGVVLNRYQDPYQAF